ncbi:hypothetical protein M8C21_010685 [Ambrosia artemisiifolia]|uniref:Uncharacterized protein n=1 Tax=Ambrosia artemisiifolia TaxID=4212 RepID=A0AAD5GRV3_AMBAR|nr:hypothetical protein M8C21_010685 [Ambrosia artemisiifolia]
MVSKNTGDHSLSMVEGVDGGGSSDTVSAVASAASAAPVVSVASTGSAAYRVADRGTQGFCSGRSTVFSMANMEYIGLLEELGNKIFKKIYGNLMRRIPKGKKRGFMADQSLESGDGGVTVQRLQVAIGMVKGRSQQCLVSVVDPVMMVVHTRSRPTDCPTSLLLQAFKLASVFTLHLIPSDLLIKSRQMTSDGSCTYAYSFKEEPNNLKDEDVNAVCDKQLIFVYK